MTYFLDETAKFPHNHPPSLEEYARACSDAVDEACSEWPVVKRTTNGVVSTGFIGDNTLRSTLWTQSFEDVVAVAANDETTTSGTANDDTANGKLVAFEDLLSNLKDIFQSDDLGKHATKWDATFAGASLLGKLSENETDDTMLVHWKFNASPIAGRDMLYVVHCLKQESSLLPSHGNNSTTNGSETNDNDAIDESDETNFELRLTYAYASVGEEWANEHCGKDNSIDSTMGAAAVGAKQGQRVRALNCYPSCDRITVYNDQKSSQGGATKRRIVLDHLMTTDIGGCIPSFCFNNLFKSALIQANAHECEAMRDYVLSLCHNNNSNSISSNISNNKS